MFCICEYVSVKSLSATHSHTHTHSVVLYACFKLIDYILFVEMCHVKISVSSGLNELLSI